MSARRLHVAWLAVTAIACGRLAGDPSPTLRVIATPEGLPVVGVTRMTFTAESSGLPGGPPDYAWSFGDGAMATGATVGHVFPREGAFDVIVKATGGGQSVQTSVRIAVRSLTGAWSRPDGGPAGFGFGFNLVQRETTLESDIYSFSLCPGRQLPTGTIRGKVEDPRTVRWTLVCGGQREFVGVVAPDLNSSSGSYVPGTFLTYSLSGS